MEIEYPSHFLNAYRLLDPRIKKKAETKEVIFRKNPFDPRLKTHKLHGSFKAFHSFSIDRKFRIIFKLLDRGKAVFLDVGNHDVYH